ncbi:MAG: Acyl-[acyl-carrier-protein]--UDP-N-acetylglucosamine O-acyltransferase [Chlamydiales bacterium]|nr:Acyl-[acyl-carrier-protein]--UDP-N-acetylglucosamine O-acyltransferase [Chlamydiales bacterium]MCH9635765.1 Acyl-[acyl-carrier-protein]--UDP-N-acetylglucosamine O-acyltransferase [Chlamydiales bacterium]
MDKGKIHPQAFVEEGATIGKNVTIEPFAVVRKNVVLGDNVTIKSHAYVDGFTTIGDGTTIWPQAVVGTRTQDLKFRGEKTFVRIGKNCHIRECATINSSTHEGSSVVVGDSCLIMAYCHVAHHCEVGNNVVMSNNSLLAGHVIVEDNVTIGGMTPIHQYVRIGKHAMVGGMSRVTHDVPPYTIGGGIPYIMGGINRIGLRRRGFSFETRRALFQAYRLLYRSKMALREALDKIDAEVDKCPEIEHFIEFCRQTKRGLIGTRGIHEGISNKPKGKSKDFADDAPQDLLVEVE